MQQRKTATSRQLVVVWPARRLAHLLLPLALLGAIVGGGLRLVPALHAALGPQDTPVYTIAALQRALTTAPGAWIGRPVLVQGQAARYRLWCPPDSIVTRPVLIDPARASRTLPLELQWGSPDPLWALARRWPMLRFLAPPAQRLRWGQVATYRLQLIRRPSPRLSPCADAGTALLLDADGQT